MGDIGEYWPWWETDKDRKGFVWCVCGFVMAEELLDDVLDGQICEFLLPEFREMLVEEGGRGSKEYCRRMEVMSWLSDDQRTSSALERLYGGNRGRNGWRVESWQIRGEGLMVETDASNLHPSVRKDQEALVRSVSDAAVRDVNRGVILIRVPHLRVPWGSKLGEWLWERFDVRLLVT